MLLSIERRSMTWLDRILARFGYTRTDAPRPYTRVNNGADAIARGQRWQAFAEEEGGLYDMIASLRADYFAKVGQLNPSERDKLLALGMADKIAREIEGKVRAVIDTGHIRAKEKEHTERVTSVGRYR